MSNQLQDQTVIQENPAPATQPRVALQVEQVEPVIAPRVAYNHNENILATRLEAEEVEPVIAPRLSANHNETVLE